ncbi:MAG: single-stranded-DNA-specific exonuclease RecJ [Candidatus Omnitrophica bacterium]|nr:single-stranded-DNA-specific exonuclease RecJ [Candidatus Omnitrophota bacterium]MDD5652738.1 single-stranded-DNA-specific exonuclease RecJ [Candidatus Omnitrophota bacterium]
MSTHKILKITPANEALAKNLAKELGISAVCAQLLLNRGLRHPREAHNFLKPSLAALLDPFSFSDMKKAIALINQAIKEKKKVLIYGDYDVDGVTALTILKSALIKKGLDVSHYIPHRIKEGYGLNKNILQAAKEKGIGLLITVDCGTSSHAEIKALKENGIQVIVTDHHQASGETLPQADAILNPKLESCNYQYKDLAGVGVAFKLAQALAGKNLADELDLVSLGTIADVVPLTGENRVIAKEGLKTLTQAKRLGIKALIETSRLGNREINSTFVSYILSPRLNASGRVATAETALQLLMSENKEEALGLAKNIETLNRERQKIEAAIMEEARSIIDSEIDFKEHKIMVLAKEGWHQGVLGIVASKLADRFYRPTIVISLNDGLCRGSGRSIKSFHLFQALCECKEFLHSFGGHSHAVGLVVNKDNVAEFKKVINRFAREKMTFEDLLPAIEVDMEVGLSVLNEKIAQEIALLQPFGAGNPQPLFFTRNLKLKGEPQVLSRDTLKFWVTDGKNTSQAIAFGMASLKESLVSSESLDLVYSPKIDTWRDEASIILETEEIFLK